MRLVATMCMVLVGAAALAGCSLLFDGDALLPDAAVAPADLAVAAPDDLTAPPSDLAQPPPDLTPPCVPGVFAGSFGDGGVFDCPCGCTLDPFTAAPSTARWAESATPSPGWAVAAGGGILEFVRTSASNGEAVQLTSNYQLAGDFELRIDYSVVTAQNGSRGLVAAYGPYNGTTYVPTFYGNVYSNGTILRGQAIVDDNVDDFSGVAASGTIRLRRSGGTSCAAVLGVNENCRAEPEPLLHWFINVAEANQSCVLCGTVDWRFSNARLVYGRLVPP